MPLLEVYNPIHSILTGKIIAVAEFYLDATELEADLRAAHARAWAVVALVTGMTFLALFGIVRSGSRTIEDQTRRLTMQLLELARISAQNEALWTRVEGASQRVSETKIARRFPAVAIVMLTVSEADDDLLAALKTGARGYALKGVAADELTGILQGVAAGASYVPPALAGRVLAALQDRGNSPLPPGVDDLTARETDILRHVATGRSNKEIARALDLQEKTIKHYMTNILQKLQVRNRVEAALKARELGLS